MDESRKQFEEWRISDSPTSNLYRDSHGQYAEIGTWVAWKAWQASRASIEIKLPTELQLKKYACSDCISVTLDEVEDAILAAGIKVKE